MPNKQLPLAEAHHYFRQIVEGLEYLHSQSVIRRGLCSCIIPLMMHLLIFARSHHA
jgi:hypothetical protein